MAYNQTVTKDRILTTGASAGQVLTVQAGGTSADWQAVPGSILASDTATLANNGTLSLTHETLTAPPVIAGWVPTAGTGATSLLHFDGSNGSTTIEDSGTAGLTWTVANGATKSTAQHKFGSASLSVSGGAYVTTGGNAAWLWTGDFTVEMWIYPTTISGDYRALLCDSTTDHFNLFVTNGSGLELYSNGGLVLSSANGVITTGAWQHVALCRNAGTLKFYVNGVSVASASVGGNIGSSSLSWYIGYRANNGFHPFVGYFDEFAMWSTEARYSGDFTPQGSAYADGGSGYRLLVHGVDFTATINGDADQTTITNVSGSTLTNATFSIRA